MTPTGAHPSRRLAVVTCMDVRVDPLAVLGLSPGNAHVVRNAGGRVTDDVLRSLALSVNLFGVDTVVVMQHTRCGLLGITDEELRLRTGAAIDFLTIGDHAAALGRDVGMLADASYLAGLRSITGVVYDVDTGALDELIPVFSRSTDGTRRRAGSAPSGGPRP